MACCDEGGVIFCYSACRCLRGTLWLRSVGCVLAPDLTRVGMNWSTSHLSLRLGL